ncbi:hypothetical protein GBO30_04140 [Elizabethkingia anophelis]|uniref:hypothetical protein n=1 Tax=Elizabethkingia anophelis TaxID=1117645 RepID=UPI001629868F|nr:hypothetical protein [Elizabethkingia anophelis]MBG0504435.1 hypothetical protein [Elizabethkingia anophelis]MCT3672744.1 hypothetical protein [Elizabethkingia anophelis]MCT3680768.1 hypothetical protein [Elizabethkingia anophelis]MCT3734740.1 hypothetical protein [Elizabethkingia anophelis]MCT3768469.1 hypothetical protein [Elizabethkingia anophelis]
MTTEIFYLLGLPILILIIWTIPYFRDIFKQYRPELLGFSSGYTFLLCDIKNGNNSTIIYDKNWDDINPLLIALAILLGLIGIGLNIKQKEKQESLESLNTEKQNLEKKLSNVEKEYYKVCSDTIKFMFEDFFANSDGNGRVSIYKHQNDKFILLGRYSKNPQYNKRGREIYLDNEGFISKGWQIGEFIIHNAPKWVGNGRDYKTFMKHNCSISEEILKKINMKSCSFFVTRIENEDARDPLGVIVFEKLTNSIIDQINVKRTISIHKAQIETLIKSMKTIH